MKEGEKKNYFTELFQMSKSLVSEIIISFFILKLSENTEIHLTLVQLKKKKHASYFFLCYLSFPP